MRACTHFVILHLQFFRLVAARPIAPSRTLPCTMAPGAPGSTDATATPSGSNMNDAALSSLFLAGSEKALNPQRATDQAGDNQPFRDKPRAPDDEDRSLGRRTEREPPPLHPKERSPRRRRSRSLSSFRDEAPAPMHSGPSPGGEIANQPDHS